MTNELQQQALEALEAMMRGNMKLNPASPVWDETRMPSQDALNKAAAAIAALTAPTNEAAAQPITTVMGLSVYEAAAQADGWISVHDRMPEPGTECLVWIVRNPFSKEPYVFIDTWDVMREDPLGMGGPTIETGLGWGDNEFEDISHWMPTPGAPGAALSTQPVQAQEEPLCWLPHWAGELFAKGGETLEVKVWRAPKDKIGLVPLYTRPAPAVDRGLSEAPELTQEMLAEFWRGAQGNANYADIREGWRRAWKVAPVALAASAPSQAEPVTVPREKYETLLAQEHALSDSYVRLRRILGAMNPPSLTDPQALFAYVETVARKVVGGAPSQAEPVPNQSPSDSLAFQYRRELVAKAMEGFQAEPQIETDAAEPVHGVNCPKAAHVGGGQLHAEDDDTHYDVDGVRYCGRCHRSL